MNKSVVNKLVAIGLTAAAVVIVACTPSSDAPPEAPSEAPSAPLEATPVPSTITTLEAEMGALFAGTYLITDVEPFTITMTIPEGWESLGVPAQVWGTSEPRSTVGWMTVDGLFADPCDPTQGYLDVGPTVDDLVQALNEYPGLTVGQPMDVTISGFAGQLVELTGSDPGCSGEPSWVASQPGDVVDRPFPSADEPFDWTILDVAGDRLIIHANVPVNATPDSAAEADAIVDSTVIEAP